MAIFPVIMCGGAGTRLWPASRPSRPKQFIALAGDRSLFQETVLRVADLAVDGGRLIVVAGLGHRRWIVEQLAEIGHEATLLLEPEARDSAPAMAAAAAWIAAHTPDGIAAFVASDHHIPDAPAFRQSVIEAATAAATGRIVTLGVAPTAPSSAYGYIRPAGPGLSPIEAFVEKPDQDTAERWVAQGYLWNSGNFIVGAATLLDELDRYEPAIAAAARTAVADVSDQAVAELSDAFRSAPRVSIDYAVMEKTDRASVLPVSFAWSDLGAWDAIAATGAGDRGLWVGESGSGCLVRAPDGFAVATVGVSNLAVIVEPDAVLVCDLGQAQAVKSVVERLRTLSPAHVDFAATSPVSLEDSATRFSRWLRLNALPVWATLGVEADGAFAESLDLNGRASGHHRRARVQCRQVHVYTRVRTLGWTGPWRTLAERALRRFWETNGLPGGKYRTLTASTGKPLDDTATLYDQAFALLAMASAAGAGVAVDECFARAQALRTALQADKLPHGGWREAGAHSYQANAHMHLLEAALAWEAVNPGDPGWAETADAVVALALDHFIDRDEGFLREFFADAWSPAPGQDGRLVEPGHQFEWAWLLARWSRLRNRPDAMDAARRLHKAGNKGVDERLGVAVDALDEDLVLRPSRARLWPQTERLKSALILSETADSAGRKRMLDEAGAAIRGLWLYLEPNGLWRDKLNADGSFTDEPAPASSFYHIFAAYEQLTETLSLPPELIRRDLQLG